MGKEIPFYLLVLNVYEMYVFRQTTKFVDFLVLFVQYSIESSDRLL